MQIIKILSCDCDEFETAIGLALPISRLLNEAKNKLTNISYVTVVGSKCCVLSGLIEANKRLKISISYII